MTDDRDSLRSALPGFLILTGFLGVGKTTLLNRVLGAEHGRKIAVLVNELGRIDIDTRLIRSRSGDVMELAGGCVCHEVAVLSEMWEATNDVVRRSAPEIVILETTGIAEPAAIIASFLRRDDEDVPLRFRGVVTVADAETTPATLDRFAEARAQVSEADRILLSKTDCADAAAITLSHQALAALNPSAERAAFPASAEGTRSLVAWLLDEPAQRVRTGLAASPHAHTHQLAAATFVDEGALLAEPVLRLFAELGSQLVRAKGFVRIHGHDGRHFLEHASGKTTLEPAGPWPEGQTRSELVVIGVGLDEVTLRRRLWACRTA